MIQSQGDQRSPGIIPLAVKDAFSIIQEVPWTDSLSFGLVVNDLLNPAGQNLRIREDSQVLVNILVIRNDAYLPN
ncbi:hypothetical protein GW17_00015702 [Ensete ventricosum]|nr:hypothetical protein GW17_00015702 [Ensete ventricosum]